MDILTQVYETYRHQIYYYFYRTLHNSHIAEELTHDTFLKAFRAIDNYRGEASVKNWLYVIAANTYRNYLAKKDTTPLEDEYFLPQVGDSFGQVDEKLLIELVFQQLSQEQRELITLRDISHFSYAEIADITGLTEGQVRVRLHRARKKFREVYQREDQEDRR